MKDKKTTKPFLWNVCPPDDGEATLAPIKKPKKTLWEQCSPNLFKNLCPRLYINHESSKINTSLN